MRHVRPELGPLLIGQVDRCQTLGEMGEPAVASVLVDLERRVPDPQTRVAAEIVVRRRAAPVLAQEQRQVLGGRAQIRAFIHRSEHGVVGHTLVERVNNPTNGRFATDLVIERHPAILPVGS